MVRNWSLLRNRSWFFSGLCFFMGLDLFVGPCLFFELVSAQEAVETDRGSLAPTPDKRESPPARTHYKGREIAQTMHYLGAPWLIRQSREREEDCRKMLGELRLEPGMVVCDMGAGNGFYSLRLAKAVGPDGRVLAVDIQPEMLRLLESRADEMDVTNIKTILGTVSDPNLPPGGVDVILCVDVYHEFSHPEKMLAAMRAALKPEGVVVLVEFRTEDPKVPIKRLHKMSKAQINKELPPNGFILVREFDGLPWQHMMSFGRMEHTDP